LPIFSLIRNTTGKQKRYILNLAATFVSQAASAFSLLILTPVFHRSLGSELFGIYGVLLNLIVFSSIIDFGMNTGLLRRIIHEPQKANVLISTQFFFFIISTIASIPVFYLVFRERAIQDTGPHLMTAVLIAILVSQNILSVLFDVLIQSANKIFIGKMIRIGKVALEFVMLYLISEMKSVNWLLITSITINCIYIWVLVIHSRREVAYKISIRFFDIRILAGHFNYCIWYFLAIVATMLVFNTQLMVLASMVSAALVAKYVLVNRFFEVLRIGLSNFTIVLFPRLVSIQTEGNWIALRSIYLRVILRVFLLCAFIYAMLVWIGEPIFIAWSGEKEADTLELFRYFGIFVLMIAIDSVSAVFMSALKFNKMQTVIGIGQGLLSLILAYVFVASRGIAGMAIASIVALSATNFIFNPVYLLSRLNKEIRKQHNNIQSSD
jgi:O-antigen/teichoic acid export membrane protein